MRTTPVNNSMRSVRVTYSYTMFTFCNAAKMQTFTSNTEYFPLIIIPNAHKLHLSVRFWKIIDKSFKHA